MTLFAANYSSASLKKKERIKRKIKNLDMFGNNGGIPLNTHAEPRDNAVVEGGGG